jgi:hypothetical protein
MACDQSVEPGLEKPDLERGMCSTDYVTIQVNTSCFLCFALIYPAVDYAWTPFIVQEPWDDALGLRLMRVWRNIYLD